MKKVVIVSRNILDVSRIENELSSETIDLKKYKGLGDFVEFIDGNSDEITTLIDYSIFDSPDDIVELIPNVDDDNISVVIFGPHELMRELASYYAPIQFVARSIFFKNPKKFLN